MLSFNSAKSVKWKEQRNGWKSSAENCRHVRSVPAELTLIRTELTTRDLSSSSILLRIFGLSVVQFYPFIVFLKGRPTDRNYYVVRDSQQIKKLVVVDVYSVVLILINNVPHAECFNPFKRMEVNICTFAAADIHLLWFSCMYINLVNKSLIKLTEPKNELN